MTSSWGRSPTGPQEQPGQQPEPGPYGLEQQGGLATATQTFGASFSSGQPYNSLPSRPPTTSAGRTTGIWAIVVGIPLGPLGMVLGFISYQKAKRGNGSRAPGIAGMIVGALSAAVITLAVLSSVAASLSAYSPSAPAPQPTGTEQQDDTAPDPAASGEEVAIGTMQVGQCALEVDPSVAVVTLVDCAEWHQAEVFAEVDLGEGDYPGDDSVASAAGEQCTTSAENIAISSDVDTSALRVSTLTPNRAGWEQGTTSALCVLLHVDGRNMAGSVGTGSFTVR